MRTISVPGQNNYSTNHSGNPSSVPLSVYKDLAAELQAAQAMLDALTVKNQNLVQENQLLRQEIVKVVQSVVHLQKLVDSHAAPSYNQAPHSSPDLRSEPKRQNNEHRPQQAQKQKVRVPRPTPVQPAVEFVQNEVEPIYFEEQQVVYYSQGDRAPKEISSWWLFLGICLIVLSGFGAGYVIVRPLFENQSR